MAKPKRKKRKPGGFQPSGEVDLEMILKEVEGLKPALEGEGSGAQWGAVQKLLLKAKADSSALARAIVGRDLGAIDRIIETLRDPNTAPVEEEPQESLPDVPDETLREAMRAFRKRMKLTKLDHESKIGRSPLTSGKDAEFDSILPPHQYPSEVWRVLVSKGELESAGRGFYKLPDERMEF